MRSPSLRSSDLSASAPSTGSEAPATSRAASTEKPPRKTDRRASASRSTAQPPPGMVEHASMLAWRAGWRGSAARSSSMPWRSSAAIAAHDSIRVHAAASSSASGRPSTWRQIVDDRRRLGAGSEGRLDPVRRARRTAAPRRRPRGGRSSSGPGTGRPSSGIDHSPAMPAGRREVTSSFSAGAGLSRRSSGGGVRGELLEVVEHEQHLLAAQRLDRPASNGSSRPAVGDADLARQAAAELLRRVDVVERDEDGAVGEARRQLVHRAPRQPRLADAAGADQADQAAVVVRQQLGDAPQLDRAADEAVVGRRRPRPCAMPAASGRAPVSASCRACSSAPGVRPRSSRRRSTNCAVGLRAPRRPGRRAPARSCAARSAASSSGSASSRRADRAMASAGVDRRVGEAGSAAAAPCRAQAVALEAEPAGPGFACRRRRSRRAARRA